MSIGAGIALGRVAPGAARFLDALSGTALVEHYDKVLAELDATDGGGDPGVRNPGVQCVVHMRLDDEEIVRRLLARGRKDDKENVIRNRLKVYREETAPLIAHYEAQGLLRTVRADGTLDDVEARIREALDSCAAGTPGRDA